MNFQRYFLLFLRYSWLIVLVLATVVGGTWAWVNRQTPIFAARAVLEVESKEADVIAIKDVKESLVASGEALNTVVQSLSSNSLMLRVAERTGIMAEWAKGSPSGKIQGSQEADLAVLIRSKLVISLRRNTRLIDIVAEDPAPERARDLAAAVVTEFLAMQTDDRSEVSRDANTFLVNEAKKLKQKLETSEGNLAKYRLDNNAVSVGERQNIIVERLTALNSEVTAANTERVRIEADLTALKGVPTGDVTRMLELKSVAALPQIAELRNAITSKEAEFAAIKGRYLELHPKYITASKALGELREKMKQAISRAGDTLQQQYQTFLETETRLKGMLAEQEQTALALDKISIPYNVLQREVDTDSKLYETILTRLREVGVTQGLEKTPYRFDEMPLLPTTPVRPSKLKSILIAVLLSLAASGGLILLIDRLDSSLRTVDEAEQFLNLPVLAAIPEGDVTKLPQGGTVMTNDAGSAQAEAFRNLRASVSLLGDEHKRRTFLITSAIPSEGKTFTSLNLAAAFASQGLKTLLIDADLRRPALSNMLVKPEDRKEDRYHGLTDCLSGLTRMQEIVRNTSAPNLWLLPSGRKAPNPAELLSQSAFPQLLQSLAVYFDRIIIDSAPINAVSDALCVAGHVDAICLVARFGKTPRRACARALTLLEKTGARIAGLILNRMPTSSGAYYYYYYGDPYVKDSVYGSPRKEKDRPRTPATV